MIVSPVVRRALSHSIMPSAYPRITRITCSTLSCHSEAVSTAPGYTLKADGTVARLPLCWEHDREYADRYGHADLRSINEVS